MWLGGVDDDVEFYVWFIGFGLNWIVCDVGVYLLFIYFNVVFGVF